MPQTRDEILRDAGLTAEECAQVVRVLERAALVDVLIVLDVDESDVCPFCYGRGVLRDVETSDD